MLAAGTGLQHINIAMPRTHNQPVAVLPPPAHAEPQEDATNEMDDNIEEEVRHADVSGSETRAELLSCRGPTTWWRR